MEWINPSRGGAADETDKPGGQKRWAGKKARLFCRYTLGKAANKERRKKGETAQKPTKLSERSSHKMTVMAGSTFCGDPYAPLIIYKAAKVGDDWVPDFYVETNGQMVKAVAYASPSGAMTRDGF